MSGKKTSTDSPIKTNTITNPKVLITPVKEAALSIIAPGSAFLARNVSEAQRANQNSNTGKKAASTASASMDSVSSALNNANDLFNHLYHQKAPSRNDIRNKLELIKNMDQMENVWGVNIVNWAKCDNKKIIQNINCPCCYLCGLPITGSAHMEHKIPSVSAYLNVPNILRIHGTSFFTNWENYIISYNNFIQLTELYNLINCAENYDKAAVNDKFNEIFREADLPSNNNDADYWRELLKFWMMEFVYAHARCNMVKSSDIICRPTSKKIAAGAEADTELINESDICTDITINDDAYNKIINKIEQKVDNVDALKTRTINMFNHLNATLNAVQETYFKRYNNDLHDNTDALAELIMNHPNIAEINKNTIIAMNMRFAMNAPQIYTKINRINTIKDEINLGNTANQAELVRLVGDLNDLWPGTAERFGLDIYFQSYAMETGMSTPPPPSSTEKSAAGRDEPNRPRSRSRSREKDTENKSIVQRLRSSVASSRRSSLVDRLRSSVKSREEKDSLGGTIKNKRRTQKRITSRRRKTSKRLISRRKRYTRKQKK
jgi:hypothetical protein